MPGRPEHRRIVARAGPEADPHLGDRQFLDGRHGAPGPLDQREHPAGGELVVEAALLDGGADHQPAVAARHQIAARRHSTWRSSGAAGSICNASIWPLIGRTGGSCAGGMPPISRDQAPAASTHDIGRVAAALGDDAGDPAAGAVDLAHRAMLDQLDRRRGGRPARASRAGGCRPGGRVGLQTAAATPGFRCGSRSRACAGQPFEIDAEPALEVEGMRSCAASSRLRATTIVPSWRGRLDRRWRAPARREIGPQRWPAGASASSASSPGSVSTPAASMPAAAQLAPCPASPRSNTSTVQPACASRQATPRPITPAPMMAMRLPDAVEGSLIGASVRWHYPAHVRWVCSQPARRASTPARTLNLRSRSENARASWTLGAVARRLTSAAVS